MPTPGTLREEIELSRLLGWLAAITPSVTKQHRALLANAACLILGGRWACSKKNRSSP
ncbi:MAG: hypothetical protein LBU76_03195 [Azoarcus sp.]|jgi:hypothetical protein|nr:hypothetical protein [Azoarcus sp.]